MKERCLFFTKEGDLEGDNLAYFSLAALCHAKWVEEHLNRVYGDFNRWVQENQTGKV